MHARRRLDGDPEAHTDNERYDQQRHDTADDTARCAHDCKLRTHYTPRGLDNKDPVTDALNLQPDPVRAPSRDDEDGYDSLATSR